MGLRIRTRHRVIRLELSEHGEYYVDIRFQLLGERVQATFGDPAWLQPPSGKGARRGDRRRTRPRVIGVGPASTGIFAAVEFLTPDGFLAVGTFQLITWTLAPRPTRHRPNLTHLALPTARFPDARGRRARSVAAPASDARAEVGGL